MATLSQLVAPESVVTTIVDVTSDDAVGIMTTMSFPWLLVKHVMYSISHEIYTHDYVIKWNHFPHYWTFVQGIHRSPVNSPYKGQWRGALMFSLICTWINRRVNIREAGDLRRHHAHYDVIVMWFGCALFHMVIWGLWCPRPISQARTSNCIPRNTVGCNYLSLPEIPASDTKVLISSVVNSLRPSDAYMRQ